MPEFLTLMWQINRASLKENSPTAAPGRTGPAELGIGLGLAAARACPVHAPGTRATAASLPRPCCVIAGIPAPAQHPRVGSPGYQVWKTEGSGDDETFQLPS